LINTSSQTPCIAKR